MPRTPFVIFAIAAGLFGCATEPTPAVGDFNRMTARVAGHSFEVDSRPFYSSVAGESVTITTTDGMLNLIGSRKIGDSTEVLQVTIWRFEGVGAYSLKGWTFEGRTGLAVYGWIDGAGAAGGWSDAEPDRADSVRITAYDSLSGHIEGTFSFLAGHAVMVTAGEFQGDLRAATDE